MLRFETSSERPERLRCPARLLLDGTSTLVSRVVAETPNAFALVFATVIAPQRSRRLRLWGRRRMDVQCHIFCYLAKLLTSVAALPGVGHLVCSKGKRAFKELSRLS